MKVAVIGGDKRSVLLCSLLWQDRHRVHSFALEKAELPAEIPKAGCLQGCLYGADCVVLPTPAEKNGLINAPYAAQPLPVEELLSALWPGQLLIGGKLSRELCMGAVAQGLQVADLMQRRGFTVGNAALTAEGISMEPSIHSGDYCLIGSSIDLQDADDKHIYLIVTKDGQCMFKRIFNEGRRAENILVLSENPDYSPHAQAVAKADILHVYPLRYVVHRMW